MNPYGTGADESPYDIRTFSYSPDPSRIKGGNRYEPKDIEDQHRVGICTAISLTQNARKALGTEFSADFQYLLQKKEIDKNWNEGSSISSALKVAHTFGLLPANKFPYVKEKDRKLPYYKYIEKLKSIPEKEIEKMKVMAAKHKILAYAAVPVDRDLMAKAIDESEAGILARFSVGREWWTKPIEPIQPPKVHVSGHAVTESNYDGNSFRIANTWGTDWADLGTAYHLLRQYKPTEAWIIYYKDVPKKIEEKLQSREELLGKLADTLQELINLLKKK